MENEKKGIGGGFSAEQSLITVQPADWISFNGGAAVFSVQSAGKNLAYQWQLLLPGADRWINSSARRARQKEIWVDSVGRSGFRYRCVVTDGTGRREISSTALLMVRQPLSIIGQSSDWIGTGNEIASFTVNVSGDEVKYCWQIKTPKSETWVNSTAPSAGKETVRVKASGRNGYQYRCVITDAYGQQAISAPVSIILRPKPSVTRIMHTDMDEDLREKYSMETLTIRQICEILGAELPSTLKVSPDTVVKPCGVHNFVRENSIYFDTEYKRTADLKIEFEKGAVCAVTKRPFFDENGQEYPCIIVPSSREAFVTIGSLIKRNKATKVIAVTGSTGKTSTKEMLRLALGKGCRTDWSRNNWNNLAAVFRHCNAMSPDIDCFIQECGLESIEYGLPCMEQVARILRPNICVFTNISVNHIRFYGGQAGLRRVKLGLDREAADDAINFVFWDDPLLRAANYHHPVVSFSLEDTGADYYAENIVESNAKISCTLVEKATGKKQKVEIGVPGKHNVINAVCAFAVGCHLNIPGDLIAEGVSEFKTSGIRQNFTAFSGVKAMIDCFNSSELAVYSLADSISSIEIDKGNKRVLVLGDITGLGSLTKTIHRRIGRTLSGKKGFDTLVCYGKDSAMIAEEASASSGFSVRYMAERSELNHWLTENIAHGDLVAFKSSHGVHLNMTIDDVFGTTYYLKDIVSGGKAKRIETSDGHEWTLIPDYGAVLRSADNPPEEIILPSSVSEMPLRIIGQKAFAGTGVRRVVIPEGVKTIDAGAFANCTSLEEIVLPDSLLWIGKNAFKNCTALRSVTIPPHVGTIGEQAFAGCAALESMRIPPSVGLIDYAALKGLKGTAFELQSGTYAHGRLKKLYPNQIRLSDPEN